MPPYCLISSTVPHTFTTPTHLTLPSHLPHISTPSTHLTPSNTPITANTFLSRMHFLCLKALAPSMNTTPATNIRATRNAQRLISANRAFVAHARKTRSRSASSFFSSPASCSSDTFIFASSLFTSSSAHCSTSPSYAYREQDPVSLVPTSRARRCCSCLPLLVLQVAFGNVYTLRTLN